MSDGVSVKQISNQHKRNVQTLRKSNEQEITSIKTNQQKKVNDLRYQNKLNLLNIQNQFDNKKGQELLKNEKVLEKLKQNVEETKRITDNQIKTLQDNYVRRKDEIRQNFENQFTSIKDTNALKLKDLNDQSNLDLQILQRRISSERNQIVNNGESEKRMAKASYKTQIQTDKNEYFKKTVNEQDKFQKALIKQKRDHNKRLSLEARKNQKQLQTTQKNQKDLMNNLEKTSIAKRDIRKDTFEKQYAKMFQENESLLKNLVGKKEKLFNIVRKELVNKYTLGLDRQSDPFYDFTKLDPKIVSDEKSYTVSIPVHKEDAKSVGLKAEDRKITLTYERRNNLSIDESDGVKNQLNKYETYVSEIPVEKIVDPKTLTKKYSDGKVVFNIAFK